jgi:hypothetical protein
MLSPALIGYPLFGKKEETLHQLAFFLFLTERRPCKLNDTGVARSSDLCTSSQRLYRCATLTLVK